MVLPYMHGEGVEKGGAVGFGDVKIVKPVLFSMRRFLRYLVQC